MKHVPESLLLLREYVVDREQFDFNISFCRDIYIINYHSFAFFSASPVPKRKIELGGFFSLSHARLPKEVELNDIIPPYFQFKAGEKGTEERFVKCLKAMLEL